MQARPRLLHAWTAQVRALLPTLRATRAAPLATFALGILWAGNVTLLKVAAALPLGVCDPSTERRLRRFVANPGVVVQEIWPALLPALLAGRRGDRRFVFDPTPYRDRATVLVVGLVQRRRVLPVAWRVTAQQITWDETMPDLLGAMLAEVNAALPPACQAPQGRMTLLCDRGLVGVGIVDACQAAGWDLVLRLRSSAGDATMAVLPDGTETGVAALAAARVSGPGQRWHGPVQLLKGAGGLATSPSRGGGGSPSPGSSSPPARAALPASATTGAGPMPRRPTRIARPAASTSSAASSPPATGSTACCWPCTWRCGGGSSWGCGRSAPASAGASTGPTGATSASPASGGGCSWPISTPTAARRCPSIAARPASATPGSADPDETVRERAPSPLP